MSRNKLIENLSYEKLVEICNMTKRIDFSEVKINDRGPSWDGDLMVYASQENFESGKKAGSEWRIPIQLKGQSNSEAEVKETISFDVNKLDLLNYKNNNGCLFLCVSIAKDEKKHMYYAILSKKEINHILDLRHGEKTCRILLNRVKDHQDFLKIVRDAHIHLSEKILNSTMKCSFEFKSGETKKISVAVENCDETVRNNIKM